MQHAPGSAGVHAVWAVPLVLTQPSDTVMCDTRASSCNMGDMALPNTTSTPRVDHAEFVVTCCHTVAPASLQRNACSDSSARLEHSIEASTVHPMAVCAREELPRSLGPHMCALPSEPRHASSVDASIVNFP